MKYILLAQILLVSGVAFASDGTASCELADKSIVARTSSGLAQVSNVGDIQITCSVPARSFPTKPDEVLNGLTVATTTYEVLSNEGEKPVPSETKVTFFMKGFGSVPTGYEGVLFYLHIPLLPAARKAEARRYLDKWKDKMPPDLRSELAQRDAVERLQPFVYQHRIGRFRLECRVMDGQQVLGIGIVQLEVVLKGRFSDLGPLGVPPA